MQISEITTVLQNIILSASGVATVIIAYKGLWTWRHELKGKSEYTLAKEVLKAVYGVRNAFMHVRTPGIFAYEYPEEMTTPSGHLKPEKDYEGTVYVYDNRWKFLAKAFQELEEKTLDAQVEWGAEFQKIIEPIRKCKAELQSAIYVFLSYKKDSYTQMRRSTEEIEKEHSILYYGSEKVDNFTPSIDAAINLFEESLRPYIKK